MKKVYVRDGPTGDDWRPADWLAPESVESTNTHYFGWEKYRLIETKEN